MSRNMKIVDTLERPEGSRLDAYWTQEGFRKFYKRFRTGVELPKTIAGKADNQAHIIKKFHLRGFQFGNWVTVEDRYNYLAALYICLYDLNRVLKFPNNNIGLDNRLGIAFGARGKSSAMAHFEPWSDIINITRYDRGTEQLKLLRFIYTGGVGAFAHEYGHFLDYTFGRNYEPSAFSLPLSGGASTNRAPLLWSTPMRKQMELIMEKLYWKEQQGLRVKSDYMKRLEGATKRSYWFERVELFARLFEQYVSVKLNRMGIYNRFLSQTKYDTRYYLNAKELNAMIPEMDKLISMFREQF